MLVVEYPTRFFRGARNLRWKSYLGGHTVLRGNGFGFSPLLPGGWKKKGPFVVTENRLTLEEQSARVVAELKAAGEWPEPPKKKKKRKPRAKKKATTKLPMPQKAARPTDTTSMIRPVRGDPAVFLAVWGKSNVGRPASLVVDSALKKRQKHSPE